MSLLWQAFCGAAEPAPWRETYPAVMPDGRVLLLPIRDDGDVGVAGLIGNQASFEVVRALVGFMAEAVADLRAEVVVGLPTLGQVFAPGVAEALGHTNWVAPGYTRKRWYEEGLSVAIASSTGPETRRLWLDPRVVGRLSGKRVLLVDDVMSSGASARAGLELLALVGVRPVGVGVAMDQGGRWRKGFCPDVSVRAGFTTPLLRRVVGGWASA